MNKCFNRKLFKTAERVAETCRYRHGIGIIPQILQYMKKRDLCKEHQAYILATICWETGGRFVPVEEVGGHNMFYAPYYGRGLIQLTLAENYSKMGRIYKLNLLANPNLLITDKELNVKIAVDGMMLGWFTGVSLSDCTEDGVFYYHKARRIINGNDKVLEIGSLYVRIFDVL